MWAMNYSKTFGEFIHTEMKNREMSAREFARFVGVDSKTINKFLDFGSKDVGYPSMDFLKKLSIATHTDPCILLAMIIPEAVDNNPIRPDAMVLSQRIEELPESVRDVIDGIIAKWASK
jgi:transcriptional regulator with XRE-family HTH domain